MAGMFYTIQEVMEKLGKSEQEVRNLVKDGKIREYRDGASVLYKRDEVTKLSEGTEIIDIVADSEINLELEKTTEIQLEPDDDSDRKKPTSEGGFGLSQLGDLTKADTNIGSLGINVLGGTDDQYKITADTHAETKAANMDEIDRLDADANLESAGSGSGLLDLSLQADDTSLGAVLDDILPSGEEAPLQADAAPGDFAKVADGLSEGQPALSEHGEPLPASAGMAAMESGQAMSAGGQMYIVAPMDPSSSIYGIMMFLPLAALILAGIATAAGLRGILPSIIKFLSHGGIANLSWAIILVAVLLLLVLIFSVIAGISGARNAKSRA
jgi:excisionase family DNA binding protein